MKHSLLLLWIVSIAIAPGMATAQDARPKSPAGAFGDLFGGAPPATQAPGTKESRLKLAAELLDVTRAEGMMREGANRTLMVLKQNHPEIAPYEQEIADFVQQYVSWPAIKDEAARLYAEAFTEGELIGLIELYRSPLGKKLLITMPRLSKQFADLGVRQMRDHLPELMQAITSHKTVAPR